MENPMKQEKLYNLIVDLIDDLDDEHKEKLAELLATKKENMSEMLVYVTSAKMPVVGEMVSARVAMKFREFTYHVEREWPSLAANHDYKAVIADVNQAILSHAEFAAAPPLYRKWNDAVEVVSRIASVVASRQS